jgi:hypothetical protein
MLGNLPLAIAVNFVIGDSERMGGPPPIRWSRRVCNDRKVGP